MAPPNQSDDIESLCRAVAQLFRMAMGQAGKSPAMLSRSAAAAGLSQAQSIAFMGGALVLPARQSVAFVNAGLEEGRARGAAEFRPLRGSRGRRPPRRWNLT